MVIVVEVQDDDCEPTRGDGLEDVGDVMDVICVELQFLERANVRQIDIPGET